jgi:uncharacterized membrane protein
MKLPIVPQDKANHALYGAVICLLGSFHSIELGVVVGVFFAFGKEIYDRVSRRGTPDFLDAVATILGVMLVALPQILEAT